MSSFRHARLGVILLATFGALTLHGAVPTLSSLFPAGGQKGTTFTLTTTGKTDATVRCWTDAPGVSIQSEGKANQWKVSIAANSPAGLYQFRLYNQEGATETRWFRVGNLTEIAEVEPNDEVGKGQVVEKLPVCINARLEKAGDVDGYLVKLKKGETLSGHVDAYSLGSPVDVVAHIVNSSGSRLLTASDDRNLDPVFHFTAPEDGVYTVQLAGFAHPPQANVAYAGGISLVYRLQLTTGTAVTHVHPAAVTKGAKTEVTLHGRNIPADKAKFSIEPAMVREHQGYALVDLPDAFAPIQVVLTDGKPVVEKEPNQKPEEAMPIKAGEVTGGHITDNSDVDRFVVTMKKGEKLQANVHAKALGSALDATLQIFAPDGKSLISMDDRAGQFDPMGVWTAGVDGAYQIVVSDTLRQGGKQHYYVLAIAPPVTDVEVVIAAPTPLTLAAGKTVSVKATIKRINGHKEPLVVRASNLPVGVHAEDVEVPEKGGEVELKLVAAGNAEPSQQPIQIAVWSKEEAPKVYPALAPLRGENLRGTSLLDHTTDLWMTVTK